MNKNIKISCTELRGGGNLFNAVYFHPKYGPIEAAIWYKRGRLESKTIIYNKLIAHINETIKKLNLGIIDNTE